MTRQSEIDVPTVLERADREKEERKKMKLHKGPERARESNYVTVIASRCIEVLPLDYRLKIVSRRKCPLVCP